MDTVMLLKHIEKKTILTRYFENENQAIEWWKIFPCSEEWVIIHMGKREKSKHRYDLTYSEFKGSEELHSKHIICYSKREAFILENKINEANAKYVTTIKKIY